MDLLIKNLVELTYKYLVNFENTKLPTLYRRWSVMQFLLDLLGIKKEPQVATKKAVVTKRKPVSSKAKAKKSTKKK